MVTGNVDSCSSSEHTLGSSEQCCDVPSTEHSDTSSQETTEQLVSDVPTFERSESYSRRYPERDRKPTNFYSYLSLAAEFLNEDPTSYSEAMTREDKNNWVSAMQDEYNYLIEKGTWVLVDLPKNKSCIPCKWVYKLKRDACGNVVKYKARLVAKGFVQKYGIDFYETYSPVVRNTSLRTLLAIAAQQNFKVRHMDVDTAFLNGDLDVEVFMAQPEGFVKTSERNKVCLLKRSLYGLKQAPRAWNIKLNQTLASMGFIQTSSESCVFLKRINDKENILVAVYVDDLICLYHNDMTFDNFKTEIQKYFSCKDLGQIHYCIGLNVYVSNDTIKINQKTYIEKVLQKFNMIYCKPCCVPLNKRLESSVNPSKSQDDYPYQALIGCLMYLAINSRPDIAFTVSYLSQFNTKYDKSHWEAAKNCLRYLNHTKDICISYKQGGHGDLNGFSDADWANCPIDRRSYTGYYFEFAGGPVAWESRKQPTVALSSAEAEYMALSSATKEACFLRTLIMELSGKIPNITIYSDSQSAQKLALNPIHHNRTKHIDVRYHFIRQKINDGIIHLKYLPTNVLPADMLTKPLCKIKHNQCMQGMGLT